MAVGESVAGLGNARTIVPVFSADPRHLCVDHGCSHPVRGTRRGPPVDQRLAGQKGQGDSQKASHKEISGENEGRAKGQPRGLKLADHPD